MNKSNNKKQLFLESVNYAACILISVLAYSTLLWDMARSILSNVTVPQKLLGPSTKFNLDEIEKIAVLQSVALLHHRDISVGGTGESLYCMNDIVGAHNLCNFPSITALGQHGTAATSSKLVDIQGQWCNSCLTNIDTTHSQILIR